jgi:hypothetical protein
MLKVENKYKFQERLTFIPITDEMIVLAEEHQRLLREQHGEQNILTDDCDITGSLAQQAVAWQMRAWGFEPKDSPIFDKNIRSDKCDFEWRYEKIDVKGSPLGKNWHVVYPNSRLLVQNKKMDTHLRKGIDKYLFVKIEHDDDTYKPLQAIVVGFYSVTNFWKYGLDGSDMKVKEPTTYVLAKDCTPFKDFVFA